MGNKLQNFKYKTPYSGDGELTAFSLEDANLLMWQGFDDEQYKELKNDEEWSVKPSKKAPKESLSEILRLLRKNVEQERYPKPLAKKFKALLQKYEDALDEELENEYESVDVRGRFISEASTMFDQLI